MAVVALGLVVRADAQLKFEKTAVELHPAISDETAVAHFKYENAGKKPVHIVSTQTSCGCTVASLKSNDVAPGDKGEITATFKIGDRVGMQHKTVTVITDDAAQPTTILSMKVLVPELLQVQPVFVFWNPSEPLDPKMVTVKATGESPVKNLKITSTTPDITADVRPGDNAKEWKISVTPKKGTTQALAANLTITPEYSAKTPKLYHIGVRVLDRATPTP